MMTEQIGRKFFTTLYNKIYMAHRTTNKESLLLISKLNKMQMEFHKSLRRFMKSDSVDVEKILRTYQDMKEIKSRISIDTEERKITIPHKFNYGKLRSKSSNYRAIRLIKERACNLSCYIKSFMIQGSFATQDFIPGWSDLDTVIVLKDAAFKSKNDLLKIQKELTKALSILKNPNQLSTDKIRILYKASLIAENNIGIDNKELLANADNQSRSVLLLNLILIGVREFCLEKKIEGLDSTETILESLFIMHNQRLESFFDCLLELDLLALIEKWDNKKQKADSRPSFAKFLDKTLASLSTIRFDIRKTACLKIVEAIEDAYSNR